MNEYTEMREFLKEIRKTDEDMQGMWNYCIEHGHALICQLDRCGKNWTDMNTHALRTLEREYSKLCDETREPWN